MNGILAVILGGGAGSRLFPLTLGRSKPAVPLAGKYRLIDVPISNCINSGITRIFVLTQYNSASLNQHLANTYQFDRFRRGFVNMLAAEQTPLSAEWFQGTADAVRQSLAHLNVYRYDHLLVLAGDQLYAMDYRLMLAHHKQKGADITIGTVPVSAHDAPHFGIMQTDDDDRVVRFYEKPRSSDLTGKESRVDDAMAAAGRVYLASMGIYIFTKEAITGLLENYPDHHDFGKELIPDAIGKRNIVSYPFGGYWSDIGTIRSFWEAHLHLARRGPEFDMYNPRMSLFTNARMLPPAKIESAYIQDSLIGEASIIINAHISNSIIGIRSFINYNVTIKNSIIIGSGYFPWHQPQFRDRVDGPERPGIDEESYIENAIIDRNVSIGKRCVITNRDHIQEGEGPNFYIRDGLVVIPKNARIPDGTII